MNVADNFADSRRVIEFEEASCGDSSGLTRYEKRVLIQPQYITLASSSAASVSGSPVSNAVEWNATSTWHLQVLGGGGRGKDRT